MIAESINCIPFDSERGTTNAIVTDRADFHALVSKQAVELGPFTKCYKVCLDTFDTIQILCKFQPCKPK